MRDDDVKTSADIERDVEASRARLETTLGDIRERMTAGQIVDEVFAYARTSGGGEIVQNLGRSIRENPLPLLLVGAGVGWMMLGGGGAPARRGGYDGEDYAQGRWSGWENGHRGPPPQPGAWDGAQARGDGAFRPAPAGNDGPGLVGRVAAGVGDAASRAAGAAGDAASAIGDAASAVGDAASAAYHGVVDAAHGIGAAADGVAGAAGRAGAYADRMAGGVAHGAADLAGGMRDEADHLGRLARDGWRTLAQEQPLVLAAIGVALGAAVGAVLPSTGIENRAMGARADEVKRSVGDAASHEVDRAKALAEDAYEGVTEELGRHDLAETAVGAIDAVADRLRDAVAPKDGDDAGTDQRDTQGTQQQPSDAFPRG